MYKSTKTNTDVQSALLNSLK